MPAADRPLSRDSADGLVVAIGIVALAVAMGIGRFAFTPLLPLMLRDGSITPGAGAEWAAANYAGYLAGALTAARFSEQPRRGLLVALAGIVLTTLAVAAVGGWGGAALRFAAGVFSAWTLVCASAWCLGELARRSAAQRGAWIFTGVGLGITLAGLLTWWGGRQPAAALWLETGLLAALGTAAVAWALRAGSQAGSGAVGAARASPLVPQPVSPAMSPPMSSPMSPPMSSPMSPAMSSPPSRAHPAEASPAAATAAAPGPAALVLCYGAMGFGYIAPATFLPAMAREQVADPLVFGLTWPLFGLAAAASVAVAARWLSAWPRRRVWALAQATMALGTAVPLASQSLAALAASALFVGGTFMVATMAGLQMARERLPANPTPLLARMTAAFAAGQIAGPLLVRALVPAGLDPAAAVTCTLALATLALLASAAWLGRAAASSTDRRPIP
ncbi:MAG: YbfB/YjiJ family MFS transporter [Burkholderiales bacterium]|nr:YbfB/YjiJ family MFS transporter [Burkholderiales bacterium]